MPSLREFMRYARKDTNEVEPKAAPLCPSAVDEIGRVPPLADPAHSRITCPDGLRNGRQTEAIPAA